MFMNNWRKPWWIVFVLLWIGTFALLSVRYEFDSQWAARLALAVASVAALVTWWALRARRSSP